MARHYTPKTKKPKDDYWGRPVVSFQIPVFGRYYEVSPVGQPNRRGKSIYQRVYRARLKKEDY